MGAGNVIPHGLYDKTSDNYDMIYVFMDDHDGWREEIEHMIKFTLQAICENYETWLNDAEFILCGGKNTLVTVVDNIWSLAVILRPSDPRYPNWLEMQKIKDKLNDFFHDYGYELYERTGPWTSKRVKGWE
jgi:hypothetical protein